VRRSAWVGTTAFALAAGLFLLRTAAPAAPPSTLSDALRVRRPQNGEWFGVYLVDKKVGWLFSDLGLVPGKSDRARFVQELVFKAVAGETAVERHHREERIYDARPGGHLLSFVIEDHGDGGTQVLTGKATPKGIEVLRRRPGHADETLTLPATPETVEDADQVRVSLLRNAVVSGMVLDGMDLQTAKVTTTPGGSERRTVSGVPVTLRRATTVSEKDRVPALSVVTANGEILETSFGGSSSLRAEPKSIAQRLDKVEIFGLARLVLPRPLPANARDVPGELTLVLEGLAPEFQRVTPRQSYRQLGGDKVEVRIRAAPPEASQLAARPLEAPSGSEYLKSTLAVESAAPEIVAKAREIVGAETDAYAAARKVSAWVGLHMKKEYGSSADRATDVLRQLKGDCTEHALLSVALLRALGIPARRVDGVVYVQNSDGVPALYWHEWVEAYVGSTWTQLDPTFGQPVADATHLTLGEESQADIIPLLGKLKVVDVVPAG
jgi:transglutaminase-like putative cysteine protease